MASKALVRATRPSDDNRGDTNHCFFFKVPQLGQRENKTARIPDEKPHARPGCATIENHGKKKKLVLKRI